MLLKTLLGRLLVTLMISAILQMSDTYILYIYIYMKQQQASLMACIGGQGVAFG